VIDARGSALEDPEELVAFAQRLLERRPAAISLTVNGDLQFVPAPIAREKLTRLGRARVSVQEGVAV
jgi:methionine synthase II (cobalamin-independent)